MDFKIYRTFPQELKDQWNALLDCSAAHVPFLRYEYLNSWWDTRGGGEWPQDAGLVITAGWQDGRLVGIAPLFQATGREGKPALMLLGSVEISDYLDLITCREDVADFVDALLPFLRENISGWVDLDLYNLLSDSPTLPALLAASERLGWQHRSELLQHSPYIPLPGDWEAYLCGIDKKQRHEIRRKMRRLEESGLAVRYYHADDPARMEGEIDDFLSLMRMDSEKERFLKPEMIEHMRRTMGCAYDEGCLHLAFLEIDGEKAATHLSFDYLNRIWAYNSGVNRKWLEYSPGWVLLGYELKWANENHYREYDFMRGDEAYKYRFGAVDRHVMRVVVTP
jgi:CelD/BcsL family acetyltransferase involved in cellulose biosynthesis